MAKFLKQTACALTLVLLLSGCAHYPANIQNKVFDKQAGYRFDALDPGPRNTDSLFICLMFSGGGTRAAALAYGIIEELRNTTILVDGQKKSLLDEVDCISSVSGGSFTAAYYGLFRDRLFKDFRALFLERDIQGALVGQLFNPINWVRLASPWFSRIDMAAELYNHRDIFNDANFALLQKKGRPFVILNATNLGSGRHFDFTQEYFDAIGSRLDLYQVSRAVAASSAFPFLLSPISLKNYAVADGYEPPWWFKEALNLKDWISGRYHAAKNLSFYLDKQNTYIHLMDGGLSDNIGARAILDAYDRGFIRTRINQGAIQRLVFIVVNARTESEDKLSRRESPPGLLTVGNKTATIAMDNYSFESVTKLREELNKRVQTQKDMDACKKLLTKHCPDAPKPFPFETDIDPYVVEINFEAADQIPGENSRYYQELPTSFKLNKAQVDKLVAIGPKLLQAASQYQCLLQVIAAEAEGLPRPAECPAGSGILGK